MSKIDPRINKNPFSVSEDIFLLEAYKIHGPGKWSKMTLELNEQG